METLGQFLARVSAQYAELPALLYKPRYRTDTWTYTRLWDHTTAVAWWLRTRGVGRGDRVVLWAPNSPWWVAAFFGVARAGAVCVPLDLRSSPGFVAGVIAQTEPKLALLSPLTQEGWDAAIPACTLEDMVRELPGSPPPWDEAVAPDEIAEIMFTSGTTGEPKGVILTHGNITSNAAGVTRVIPDLPYFRLLSLLPLSHMFEQTVGLILPLNRGASIFYPAGRQSSVIFRALAEQRITTVLAVPQALQLFMDALERQVRKSGREAGWRRLQAVAAHVPRRARRLLFHAVHRRLGGQLQFFVSGGAAIDPELVRHWSLLGIPIVQGYGATETAPVISATRLDEDDPRTVGMPVPGVVVHLGPDGEVQVHGPNVSPGYWNNAAATAESFAGGWYHTGDIGRLDRSGRLYLKGRKKNVIVLPNGQNVYPEDVERVLLTLPGLSDAVVLELPDSPVHAVLLAADQPVDPDTLVRQANEALSPHQRITGCTIWPEADFPRTHTLKVKRREVLARLTDEAEGRASPAPTTTPAGATVSPLRRLVAEAGGDATPDFSPAVTLADAGLDSLARVELLAAIETELGIYLDESKVDARTTVGELERLVAAGEGAERPVFPAWPRTRPLQIVRTGLQRALFPLLRLIVPTTAEGLYHLDRLEGPALFVANHTSHLDSVVLLSALPAGRRRRLAVAAAADYFFARPALGAAVALLLNAFPFSRTTAVRPTLEHCARLLDTGWSILLYPEGTRTVTGAMGPFKPGVGLLAVELEVPVVPVYLHGLRQVLPKGSTMPRHGPVAVTFGEPLTFGASTPYEEVACRLREAVGALAPGAEAAPHRRAGV